MFKPFTDYLGKCTAKRVVYFPVLSNSAEIEAMRSGRLHVAGFSTGPTGLAVNRAGAVPFAMTLTGTEVQGYQIYFIGKKDSPYQKLADLKGKKVAHTSPSSNSGHLAPQILFGPEGSKPDADYKPCSPADTTRPCSACARAITTVLRPPPTSTSARSRAAR